MNMLRLFSSRPAPAPAPASAPIARERLQILLAHERGRNGAPDLFETLRAEILSAVSSISISILTRS